MRAVVRILRAAVVGLLTAGILTAGVPSDAVEATSSIRAYVPITPARILDTRQVGSSSISHGRSVDLRIAGVQPIPSTAVAVSLNVTVTRPTGDGYLTVWPAAAERPTASNLNFVASETVPNLVTVGIGANGSISLFGFLYSGTGKVDVIVDVTGWYAGGFNPINPVRIMDTRSGLGGIALAPGESRELQVEGREGLPSGSLSAVALNVTVVGPTSDVGYLTIWPAGTSMPTASSLNFVSNEVAANAVIVGVGDSGGIEIFNPYGSTGILVDVAGWFDEGFDPLRPFRIVDTRNMPEYPRVGPGETLEFTVVGAGDVPISGVGAVSMNITASNPSANGYLTVWPTGQPRPTASSLNFSASQTIPNAVVSGVGAGGRVSIYNDSGNVDLIVDVTGWFALSDREAPQLVSLSLSPAVIDTSSSDQYVTVTARITDDLSGNAGVGYTSSPSQIRFRSPGGSQFVDAIFSGYELVSGSTTDGLYSFRMTVPRLAEAGVWSVSDVLLADQVGNMRWQNAADLAAAGIPTSFSQVGAGDAEAPHILSLSMSPSVIDTSSAERFVTVTARITDNLSGSPAVNYQRGASQIWFSSPNGSQRVYALFTESELVSGSLNDGVFAYQMRIPRFSESGTWTVQSLTLVDQIGNLRNLAASDLAGTGMPTTFSQIGAGDSEAPRLVSLSISPSAVTTSVGSASITVTARITDNLAGNAGVGYSSSPTQMRFRSPSGSQFVDAVFSGYELVSGSTTDGQYSYQMTVPYLSESGLWTVENVLLADQVGNMTYLSTADLAAAGLPRSFIVN